MPLPRISGPGLRSLLLACAVVSLGPLVLSILLALLGLGPLAFALLDIYAAPARLISLLFSPDATIGPNLFASFSSNRPSLAALLFCLCVWSGLTTIAWLLHRTMSRSR